MTKVTQKASGRARIQTLELDLQVHFLKHFKSTLLSYLSLTSSPPITVVLKFQSVLE